jgi:hypothetical protein
MDCTYEDLANKTVAQLREIAEGTDSEAVRGYKTMHKDHLVNALCKAFGIEARTERKVVGINRHEVRAQIRKLKETREKALAARDHKQLKTARRKIHKLKRKIRKSLA